MGKPVLPIGRKCVCKMPYGRFIWHVVGVLATYDS